MITQLLRFFFRIILIVSSIVFVSLLLPRVWTSLYAINKIHTISAAPTERVAIVFGAGLRRDGYPTTILRDRVLTGANLYFSGKVEKLLMSGDNSVENYNEPEAMRQYALSLGVPDEDIVLDFAGRRTYDTCYRAKSIFEVDGALLVTQDFHLPRALFLCNMFGIKAYGIEADNFNYGRRSLVFWNIREQFATFTAFTDVFITKPLPILGEAEPIFGN